MTNLIITRRSFLQIASAAIAMPLIARAAILPELVIPGITRIQEVSKEKLLAGHARFADAIFAPGPNGSALSVIRERAWTALPYGSRYEVRALPLSRDQMFYRAGYVRDGVALLWTSDAGMQSRHWTPEELENTYLIDTGVTGTHDKPDYEVIDWPLAQR